MSAGADADADAGGEYWTCGACGARAVARERHAEVRLSKPQGSKMGCTWGYRLELTAVRGGGAAEACGMGRFVGWRLAGVDGRPVTTLEEVCDAAASADTMTLLFHRAQQVTCPACCASRTPACPECKTPLNPSGRCIVQTCSQCPPPDPKNLGQVDACLVM